MASDNTSAGLPITLKRHVPDNVADTIDQVSAGHVPYTGRKVLDTVADIVNRVAVGNLQPAVGMSINASMADIGAYPTDNVEVPHAETIRLIMGLVLMLVNLLFGYVVLLIQSCLVMIAMHIRELLKGVLKKINRHVLLLMIVETTFLMHKQKFTLGCGQAESQAWTTPKCSQRSVSSTLLKKTLEELKCFRTFGQNFCSMHNRLLLSGCRRPDL